MTDFTLEEKFKLAATYTGKAMTKEQHPDIDDLQITQQLAYYSLYKQATLGDRKDHPDKAPGWLDFKGKKKWEEWGKHEGMSKEEAMKKYIEALESYVSDWFDYKGLDEHKKKIKE